MWFVTFFIFLQPTFDWISDVDCCNLVLCKPKKHMQKHAVFVYKKMKFRIEKECINVKISLLLNFVFHVRANARWLPTLEFKIWNQHSFGANVDLIGFPKQTQKCRTKKEGNRKHCGNFKCWNFKFSGWNIVEKLIKQSPFGNKMQKYLIFGWILYLFFIKKLDAFTINLN